MDADKRRWEGRKGPKGHKGRGLHAPICDSPFSFGAVLTRRRFAVKLTVMFSTEAAEDERDETDVLEKNVRKQRFFRGNN